MSDENIIKINTSENEKDIDTDNIVSTFENDDEKNNNEENSVDRFDRAFKEASPIIQEYILNEKLEKDIALICNIEKIVGERAKTIIENVLVSILVGILPISEAKETMIDSFKNANVDIDSETTDLILKDIDSHILTDIRKKILTETNKEHFTKEIRHITLKQKNEEKEKDELRKILLERTGNISGKGQVLIQYKERLNPVAENVVRAPFTIEKPKHEVTRDSLLEKMHIKNIVDTNAIKERFIQIQKEEELRMKRFEAKRKEEEERKERIKKITEEKEKEIYGQKDIQNEEEAIEEELDLSATFAEKLKEKLNANEDKKMNLDLLREERGKKEEYIQKNIVNKYNSLIGEDNNEYKKEENKTFDPYREDI